MKDPSLEGLEARIDDICPGAAARLEEVASVEAAKAIAILEVIVRHACDATFVPVIEAGRECFNRLDPKWVREHFVDAVPSMLNFEHDWDFARLLEMLSLQYPDLVVRMCEYGSSSKNPHVRQIADEYRQS